MKYNKSQHRSWNAIPSPDDLTTLGLFHTAYPLTVLEALRQWAECFQHLCKQTWQPRCLCLSSNDSRVKKSPAPHDLSKDEEGEVVGCFKNQCLSSLCWSFFIYEIEYFRLVFKGQNEISSDFGMLSEWKTCVWKRCPVYYWSGSLLTELQKRWWWNVKMKKEIPLTVTLPVLLATPNWFLATQV